MDEQLEDLRSLNVGTVGNILSGSFHAAHGDGLDGVVERTQADVADGGLIVGHSGHNAVGAALDGGSLGGHVHLLAGIVLLFHAGQLDESTAGTGTIFTGDDRDILVGVKVGGFRLGGLGSFAGGSSGALGSGGRLAGGSGTAAGIRTIKVFFID